MQSLYISASTNQAAMKIIYEIFIEKNGLFGRWRKKAVPIYAFVSLLTLDVILRCAFSYEKDVQAQG